MRPPPHRELLQRYTPVEIRDRWRRGETIPQLCEELGYCRTTVKSFILMADQQAMDRCRELYPPERLLTLMRSGDSISQVYKEVPIDQKRWRAYRNTLDLSGELTFEEVDRLGRSNRGACAQRPVAAQLGGACPRCTYRFDTDNPMQVSGKCLYCEIEGQGHDIRQWLEENKGVL